MASINDNTTVNNTEPDTTTVPNPIPTVLLRVKRKRTADPLETLLVGTAAAINDSNNPNKRSALTDIRTALKYTEISESNRKSAAIAARRIYHLVGTQQNNINIDESTLININVLQSKRLINGAHPAVLDGGLQINKIKLQTLTESISASISNRQSKLAAVRSINPSVNNNNPIQQSQSTVPVPGLIESDVSGIVLLDVQLQNQQQQQQQSKSSLPSAGIRRKTAKQLDDLSIRNAAIDRNRQELEFSAAMTKIKKMDNSAGKQMEAYQELLNDYFETLNPLPETNNNTSNIQFKQAEPEPEPEPESAITAAVSDSVIDDSTDYVYDVYHLIDNPTEYNYNPLTTGSVDIDESLAYWCGLILQDHTDSAAIDSDEDLEDENRESNEANDYPEEEESDTEAAEDPIYSESDNDNNNNDDDDDYYGSAAADGDSNINYDSADDAELHHREILGAMKYQ